MDRIKPITPDEIIEQKAKDFPDAVIAVWNSTIAKNWSPSETIITQPDIVAALEKVGFKRTEIYSQGYLDIENIYREAGWDVIYDKPGYNETYEAFFAFRRKKKK